MTSLELVLLGGFQARAAGQPVDVPGRKERALLAFLAMPPGEPRSRDRLCRLLWSDRGDKQARDSLKQAVLRLRKSFDSAHPLPVLADRASLVLDGTAIAVDVQDFERLLKKGTPEAVARAAALYRGDLLDGLDVPDPAFEEWLLVERQRLRDLAREAMGTLVDHHLTNGTRDQAAAMARRLLALDPLRESAHRALMQIYAEQGQAALALKQYQLCRDVLQNELGVAPEAETERLYRSIKGKRAAARRTPGPAPEAPITAETSAPLDSPSQTPEVPVSTPKPAVAVLPFEKISGDPEQRRLTAIMAADVVGYSRLMELDEAGTLARLQATRRDVVMPRVASHGGRVVKLMGDGSLVEFGSIVSAVACAAEIQEAMAAGNAGESEDRCIRYRIGLNLGDVIVEGEDIYGDGVNVAARLQEFAPPGGIALSAAVKEQVGGKVTLSVEDLGEHMLRNIERPIRVFTISNDALAQSTSPLLIDTARPDLGKRVPLCVLPFSNMSGDAEQDYFSDGITEDIITDLGKVASLFVISRNTAFSFKGKAVNSAQVARQLNVKYVLEGSVRKAGTRLRITAQLVEGISGGHIWAERYDRTLDDIFALQDDISAAIVAALKVKLLPEERKAIAQQRTSSAEAYELLLMARHYRHFGVVSGAKTVLRLAKRAVELDPNYAEAWALIAACQITLHENAGIDESGLTAAERALRINPRLATAHAAKGRVLAGLGRYDEALTAHAQSLHVDPESFDAHFFYGHTCSGLGRAELAIRHLEKAATLSETDYGALGLVGQSYEALGRSEEARAANRRALARMEQALARRPDDTTALCMGAASLATLGETERARDWANRASLLAPEEPVGMYNLACTFALLNEPDRAIDLLERYAVHMRPQFVAWIRNDSDLDSLRADPRFQALVQRMEGQAALALKQYQLCRDALQGDLGVEPDAETEQLYQSIKKKRTKARLTPGQEPSAASSSDAEALPDAAARVEEREASDLIAKPAVAVMPFENMSGDPEQRYFSDAVSENIITELSRFRSLSVIARHSSFALRDQRLEIADVARRLGVQYVVEGSVLRAGERLRITARLVDADSGVQLWADRYDRELRDVFTVQDEVVRMIAAILSDRIDDAGSHSARRKRPENLAAYDYFLRGAADHLTYDEADNAHARQMFEKAIALDPDLAVAYAWLATQYIRDWVRCRSIQAKDRAFALAQRGVALDPNDSVCQMMLGYVCLFRGRLDDAEFHLNRAVNLNPNDPNNAVTMAWFLGNKGRPEEAINWIDQAFRLNPYAPPWYFIVQGAVMHAARRYAEAVAAFNRVGSNLDPADVMYLTACYGQLGRFEDAQAQIARFQVLCPGMTMLQYAASEPLYDPNQFEHLLDGLRKAGCTGEQTPSIANPPVPAKPTIAVLPFQNLSGDPDQQYLSDGITEDIITELSRFRTLLVIARNSSFQFRDRAVDLKRVGQELGVGYVVEGSIRKAGNRVRISVQLIDAATNGHLWAEHYDPELQGIFDVQDDMTQGIVSKLAGRLETAEEIRARRKPTENLLAYECLHRAKAMMNATGSGQNEGVRRLLQKAIELDPTCGRAHSLLALTHIFDWQHSGAQDCLVKAVDAARSALAADDQDSWSHFALGFACLQRRQFEQAYQHYNQAVALNPNDADIVANMGELLTYLGRPEEGIEWITRAMRLNPLHPPSYWNDLSGAYYDTHRYQEAATALLKMPQPFGSQDIYLSACYAQMGDLGRARGHADAVLKRMPDFSARRFAAGEPYQDEVSVLHLLDGLRKAGLPE